jgi:hypothetical protein
MTPMTRIESTRPFEDQQNPVETSRTNFRSWPIWCVFIGCASAILLAVEHGYEGPFYRLTTLLHHPTTAEAPFGYRLLLPWLGLAMQAIRPSLSDHNVFIYTQILAIVAALALSGEWTEIFLPRIGRPLAYLVATAMICPTIAYWTFYDNAIVAFWAGCLLLLYYERPVLFVILLAIGTLNHENTLLLVPCALAYWWPTKSKRSIVLFGLAQVAAWAAVRWLVVHYLASGAIFDNHIWNNLHPSSMYTLGGLFLSVILLLPWWALAALGWKHSPYILKCASISLPELILITFLFGKFDEPRQFVAFIPACVGLIACWVGHELGKLQTVRNFESPEEDAQQVA